jgi:2-amino-4-hydroxy-6-hydroxymethyldihydropteridine diphosphokinase
VTDLARHLAPPRVPEIVYLGLGGNVGDRLNCLRRGLFALLVHPEIRVDAFSRVWESEYVGPGEQRSYLNACCRACTSLAPAALLAVLKGIEQRLGRAPGGHLRPRPLDLDILLFGDRCGAAETLTLPHPRLAERGFVLAPLAELSPDLILPDSGETTAAAWARIQRLAGGPWLRPWPEGFLDPTMPTLGEEGWRAALAVHCR